MQKEKSNPHPDVQSPRTHSLEQQKEEENEHEGKKNSLFYQQPGCVSKLRTFRDISTEVGKETVNAEVQESPRVKQNGSPAGTPVATATVTSSSPTHNTSEPAVATTPTIATTNDTRNTPPSASTSLSVPCLPAPRESPGNTPPTSSPHLAFQANDQLLRVLTERSGHWFSLLPRNPCDLASLTTTPPGAPRVSPQASSTPARPRSPPQSPALPLTPSAASASGSPHHPTGLLSYPLSALQVRLLGRHEFSWLCFGLLFCTVPCSKLPQLGLYPNFTSTFLTLLFFFFPPQVKSGGSLLGVSFGSWPSGMISPSLPLCSSPSPMPGHSLEGNTAASVSSKSESPLPRIDKISSMPSPALEMPKSLDHPLPQPIPEGELQRTMKEIKVEAVINNHFSNFTFLKRFHLLE